MVSPEEEAAVRVRWSLGYVAGCRWRGAPQFHDHNTVPNALLRRIHNRMPVIFDALQAKQWLDPLISTRPADIAAVLAPFPSEQMQAHKVSSLVNKPEADSAECIIPAPDKQFRLL